MAEKCESNFSALNIRLNIDCSEALKGLKAVTRAAKKATAALKELEEQQCKINSSPATAITVPLNISGKEITAAINEFIKIEKLKKPMV